MSHLWKYLKAVFYALQPAMYSIVILIIGFLGMVFVSQGRDAILSLSDGGLWPVVLFVCVVIIWACQTWYWARIMYVVKHPSLVNKQNYLYWVAVWVPRTLGVLVFFVAAFATFSMRGYSSSSVLGRLSALLMILAVVFFVFTLYRRPVFKLISLEKEMVREPQAKERDMSDLSPWTRRMMRIFTAIALVQFALYTIDAELFTYGGAAVVMVVCFSIWIPLSTWFGLFSHKWKVPVFLLVFLFAMILSYTRLSDNHSVRIMDVQSQQVTFEERLNTFLEKYPTGDETVEAKPLYLVSTYGGGIRSAFWTACILGRIQDIDPQFSEHVFAISSVSGGSLGGAVFAALAKEKQEGRSKRFFEDSQEILKGDFLAPTIGLWLTGDTLQKIIPYPIPYLSRSRALEVSWEIAWKKAIGTDRFGNPLTKLWDKDSQAQIPSLFLNSTLVETGQRIIASNIKIEKDIFVDTLDVYQYLDGDMQVSTAANNSARFPFVSPIGTLKDGTHLADGGYFDNSGAQTLAEVLLAIHKSVIEKGKRVKYVVIMLENDPEIPMVKALRFLPGILGPLETLLSARQAHATTAADSLRDWVNILGGDYMEFHLREEAKEVQFPLGWSLSEEVRKDMAEKARKSVDEKWGTGAGGKGE